MFGPNADRQSVVEVTLRGGRKLVKCRRDFLTGGIVEQAVSSAIDQAVFAAEEGRGEGGLSAAGVIDALRQHVDALGDSLTAYNAADHVDLPEGVQVAAVRRLRGGPLPASLSELDP
jgi:hypothetical protein